MKKHIQKILFSGVFLSTTFAFGQFNTLKPIVPKTEPKISLNLENSGKTEFNKDEKSKENPRKEKKFLKKVFGITTKSDLKNQLDSLKILMKNYTDFNNEKWNLQNSKDSLILNTQTKIFENKNTKKPVQEQGKAPFGGLGAFMPLNNKIQITSGFGIRTHPIFGVKKSHNGIDLKAHYENVYSVMDGIVTASGWDPKGGGNYIKINHFGRFETAYLHLSEIYYKVGERVKAGFIIAKSGNTGNSTGPHLHFSVREFGQLINPTHFLNDLIKVNNLIATHYAK
ncbi:Murein DD-endopeptidase MepM and murein hydrolase activator NlpD, contain LysM domain [Epilithonimonas bovis DSM 19482]|uniref:Murein DD-endopeptidase MepM and murein hydrolase activator NlpD, contain LysM domain n=1 Tax=Epilithonimonas bovis DSM 19482 TaxID=1121284 RepID=A0A1U7PRB0_9FLAO|nr:M23 family metallopeptidase [Epilithonimonas bovis]SIT96116.1 Murein DD-endopeptidase MepM and murein hydrolase activator NlpD, contain LysM domain [Epilithonimonas bovis DSM 19482]